MNQFKPAQVIMLPTEDIKNSAILLGVVPNNAVITNQTLNSADWLNFGKPQHLYIISDDEIKESDWKYNEKLNCITQHCRESKDICDRLKIAATWCKKIIATTDNSIYLDESESNGSYIRIKFPKPSQQFIEKYIEEYNKGEVITDVLVEYERIFAGKDYVDDQDAYGYDKFNKVLKINQDNTITIKKIKDSWSREEVISNIIKHRNDFLKFKINSHYNPNDKEIKEWDDNWIKENL